MYSFLSDFDIFGKYVRELLLLLLLLKSGWDSNFANPTVKKIMLIACDNVLLRFSYAYG